MLKKYHSSIRPSEEVEIVNLRLSKLKFYGFVVGEV